MNETPVARLNNMLAKHKIIPKYGLIYSESYKRRHTSRYIMRVTCPIVPGGQTFSAEGYYGVTKKEAKHNAALTFMQAFLNCGTNIEYLMMQTYSKSTDDAGTEICCEGLAMLKAICKKNNLGRPKVEDLYVKGSAHKLTYTAECTVSDLSIKGRGNSRVEARLHATARMMQILMETASIYTILKSSRLIKSEIQPFVLKSSSNAVAYLSNELEGSLLQLPVQAVVSAGKRKMDARTPEKPKDVRRSCNRPDTAKTLLELTNARKTAVKIEYSNNTSEGSENPTHLAEDSQEKTCDATPSNNTSDCVDSAVVDTNLNELQKGGLTQLQAESQMKRNLTKLVERVV